MRLLQPAALLCCLGLLAACQTAAPGARPVTSTTAAPAAQPAPAAAGRGDPLLPDAQGSGSTRIHTRDRDMRSFDEEGNPQIEPDSWHPGMSADDSAMVRSSLARRALAGAADAVGAAVAPINGLFRSGDPALLGMSQPAVAQSLGQPTTVRDESPAEVWQYRGDACVLDVVFMGRAPASHVSARQPVMAAPGQIAPVDSNACAASLQRVPS